MIESFVILKDLTPFPLEEILEKRKTTLAKAYEKHPERFVRGPSKPKKPPREAWINNPDKKLLKVGA